MGVHGLTTFLRENRRQLCQTLELLPGTNEQIPVVVDGWSFIYNLTQNSSLPWIYGGDMPAFSALVEQVVLAWLNVGIKPYFVWDGPPPPAKFDTMVKRLNESNVRPMLLFFRTSSIGRSTRGFFSGLSILPPLSYPTCVSTILSLAHLGVECHFADEEADGYAVELAALVQGYVAALDSDFVILDGHGYMGYLPLDEMTWTYPSADDSVTDPGFVPIRSPRFKPRNAGRGLIPNPDYVSLSVNMYSPESLAAFLKLPSPLLPLLAAFVGNDYSSRQRMFYDRKLTNSQRILRTAEVLRPFLRTGASPNHKRKYPTSVVELVDAAISSLLLHPLSSPEQSTLVEEIVNSVLQYGVLSSSSGNLWPTKSCAVHDADDCSLVQLFRGRAGNDEERRRVGDAYMTAYRSGRFAPDLLDILSTSTMWPRLFLEQPDVETVTRVIGRPIRLWVYAILHHGIGLSKHLVAVPAPIDSGDQSLSDTSSAPSSSIAGDWSVDEELLASPTDSSTPDDASTITISEYCRRGNHVKPEEVLVPSLQSLLQEAPLSTDLTIPIQLRSLGDRLELYLTIFHSNTSHVRALSPDLMILVTALRWTVRTISRRAAPSDRWHIHEASAFLHACLSKTAWDVPDEDPPIEPRHVQLTAEILSAIEAATHLAQVLLLDGVRGKELSFSGTKFHSLLTKRPDSLVEGVDYRNCWQATLEGLEDAFGLVQARKSKRDKKESKKSPPPASPVKPNGGSIYSILAELPVD